MNIIAAEGIRKEQAISIHNPAKLSFYFRLHNIPCKVVGMASKLPGILTYSSYNSIAAFSEVYTTMEELESEIFNIDFSNMSNVTTDGVRKRQFILKYKNNVKKDLREMLYFSMNNYLQG